MALSLSEVQALSDDRWQPGVYPQWGKGNIMFYELMKKKERAGSSEYARVLLEYAKTRGGPFGAASTFDTSKKAQFNAARFPWGFFWTGATIDIDDEVKISGGPEQIKLVYKKVDSMRESIKAYIGDSLWELYATQQATYGADTKPLYGIADMMNQSDTSPAFGLINKADLGTSDYGTNIWLAFQDATEYTMDFSTMQVLRRGCRTGNETFNKPNLYVTDEVQKDRFEESLDSGKRHYSDEMAKAGFEHVMVGSSGPLVADDRCPASYVHGFNTKHLYFQVHEDFDFETRLVWMTPTNQPIKTTQLKVVPAFLTDERRANGRLTNLTTS